MERDNGGKAKPREGKRTGDDADKAQQHRPGNNGYRPHARAMSSRPVHILGVDLREVPSSAAVEVITAAARLLAKRQERDDDQK